MTQSHSKHKSDQKKSVAFDNIGGHESVDEIAKMAGALDGGFAGGKVTALSEGGKVLLMIQDAPDELRRLADEMERIGVQEIKAFVAYAKPPLNELSVAAKVEDSGKAEDQEAKESTT
jgi:hypothetical protein